ncbi:right-handed parallel beta-helix repeat-containing protein, partial [uncultured Methanobrevibacter sp.]|uniref:beta strand repeat-containing protein n=1 Tax=uncultured Methanobrevibacter sp. TaxID=253161 RepID=UPI002620F5BD
MDKLKSKILLVSFIIMVLFSVQAIAAADAGDVNLTSENIDLSVCDIENNVNINNQEELLTATNTDDTLTADEHPFSELQGLIDTAGAGGTIDLAHNYILTENNGTLVIPYEITINGNGYTLDANHLGAILVTNSKIILNNITFINGNCTGVSDNYKSPVILKGGSVGSIIDNCIFKDNEGINGGALYWAGDDGKLTNSKFENNCAVKPNEHVSAHGGAIYWAGDNATIEKTNFTGNKAPFQSSGGAIYFTGVDTQLITDSYFYGNTVYGYGNSNVGGGAIFYSSSSNGRIVNTKFEENSVNASGGAILFDKNSKNHTITDSSFIKNTADGFDSNQQSGVFGYGGGAIYWMGSDGKVENCNFTENSANMAGAIYYKPGSDNQIITGSSFSNNAANKSANSASLSTAQGGGAIYWMSNNGRVENCNFTENSAFAGGAIYYQGDKTWSYAQNHSIVDSSFSNNVVNVLDSNNCGGAIYYNSATDSVIENSNFTENSAMGSGGAIYNYNGAGTQSITDSSFANNVANASTGGSGGAIVYESTKNAVIENVNFTENYAKSSGGAISFAKNSKISHGSTHSNITNANFIENTAEQGGAISYSSSGNAIIEDVNFTENSASKYGGAIYSASSSDSRFANANFVENSAQSSGGAFYGSSTNNQVIVDSSFSKNTANGTTYKEGGGAIFYSSSSNGIIENVNFTENSAKAVGGAICYYGTGNKNQLVNDSSFSKNTANMSGSSYGGGAIYWASPNGRIMDSTFDENSAKGSGGAILYYGSGSKNQTITGSDFSKNAANATSNGGGAIYCAASDTSIVNTSFDENSARGYGGAIYYNSAKGGHIMNANFTENSAKNSGGAIYYNSANDHVIEDSSFTKNTANGTNLNGGGAIYYGASSSTGSSSNNRIENVNFTENSGTYGGAVYYARAINQTITDSSFSNNQAKNSGGAIHYGYPTGSKTSDSAIINTVFTENSAKNSGGAISYMGTNNQSITNSSFSKNTANGTTPYQGGGAIYYGATTAGSILATNSSIENVDFIDNLAKYGGAIYYGGADNQSIADSNFTGNNATSGSAIYHTSGSLGISSTELLENQAHSDSLAVEVDVDGFDITIHTVFKGLDNILNAIYSKAPSDVKFTDVTYWGADGKMNTGSSEVSPVASADESNDGALVYTDSREAGINITVSLQNIETGAVENITASTNIYGDINYTKTRVTPGKYKAVAIHYEDKYYTEIQKDTTFEVPKANSTIMADNVTVTYDSDVVLNATGENATGVDPASVVVLDASGNPVTGITVTVNGFNITISGLIPGNYTVKYNNTVSDEAFYSTANNVTGVRVLKANSTIMAENQTVVYNATVVLVATGENATGVDPASIVVLDEGGNPVTGITVTVQGNDTIIISGLIPGN